MRWAAAVGMAVALSACAPGSAPTAAPEPSDSAPAVPAVPAALDWSVAQLGGGQIDGGDLAGRDVVLWFWAPW